MTRFTEKEAAELQAKVKTPGRIIGTRDPMPERPQSAPKPSKYKNVCTDGYASKKEAKRAGQLQLLLLAGEIRNLKEQVKYELIPEQRNPLTGTLIERQCRYVADFVYEAPNGMSQGWHEVVEDTKGHRTDVYRIKRKLMLKVFGIRIREV